MYTEHQKIDFKEIASNIAEWAERNYGYFINKSRDEVETIKDLATQLERLPFGSMSYIEQAKNNFIDRGIDRPPLPVQFINEIKICFDKNREIPKSRLTFFEKITILNNRINSLSTDGEKIKYIEFLSDKGKLEPIFQRKSILTMEIMSILNRNNYQNEKIREIINS
jgi:hypothetical protein